MANRAVSTHVTDFTAMLVLLKFLFFFDIGGVSTAMALVLTFISYRCWRAQ
jgi:hypothetical protein